MPKNVTLASSRKALVARALQAYFSDKLAQDAQIDYSRIVRGVTAANWAEQRPVLLSRIKIATNGKLTNDKAMEGVDGVLKMLDKTGEDEMDEEEETEDERKEREAEDKRARDKKARDEKEEEERKEEEFKDKRAKDKRARDRRARDNMTEEEREADDARREAEDKRARDEEEEERKEKEVKDKRARDAEREKERSEDKKAMDAAILDAKTQWKREQRELNEARDLVTPVIGVVLAQDSAQDYYELLFDKHDVDYAGIPPAGFKALATQVIARVTAKPNPRPTVKHANDSAVVDFNKRFPDVARIRVA